MVKVLLSVYGIKTMMWEQSSIRLRTRSTLLTHRPLSKFQNTVSLYYKVRLNLCADPHENLGVKDIAYYRNDLNP